MQLLEVIWIMKFRGRDLFTHDNVMSMCTVESTHLRDAPQFKDLCETQGPVDCCPGWNLGGYIALLNNRSSCFGITPEDVQYTKELLYLCSRYYHNGDLFPDCMHSQRHCRHIPKLCATYNAVYNIFHFLTDDQFMARDIPLNRTRLTYAMAFLPIARSSATLDYFHAISKETITDGRTKVVAMDFGLKETLFDEYLFEDAVYLGVAGGLIVLAILVYTQSFFLTLTTTLSIVFSLSLAYFLYSMLFGIDFFPFMNILAAVIAIGVGADDTFILVKSWSMQKPDPNLSLPDQMEKLVLNTLQHSTLSMLVTSLTTAMAFFASYISSITAIKCFSIFAGLAIMCNFLLMISWTPASLVVYQRYCQTTCCCCLIPTPGIQRIDTCRLGQILCSARTSINGWCRGLFERRLPHVIMLPRYLWVGALGSLFVGSVIVVLYRPGLRLPDKEQFQLFNANHIFERYDMFYKKFFAFEQSVTRDISMRMPLRFLWGVKSIDNGDNLNPADMGSLVLDPGFDLTTPDAQRWMLKFCHDARKQSFYSHTMGPQLSNCFMETFKKWMDRRCNDTLSGKDKTPCCQATKFPYPNNVFEKCLVLAIGDLYATPTDFWIPGVAGPKFNITTSKVQAMIVEYDAWQIFSYSHHEMSEFYHGVNNWFSDMARTAPPELQGGFFVSYLSFYDVQSSLSRDTLVAIALALMVAVLVLFICTFNVFLSLISVLTVCAIIFVSIAILVLLGWKLNILESVAITFAIGLSVDFTLHYSIMYRQSIDSDSELNVIYSVTNMSAPITMAALTTMIAGLCLIPSRVLAYIQIGTFIVIVMTISWLYSTFFFQSILRIIGPTRSCWAGNSDLAVSVKDYYVDCCETDHCTETGSSEDVSAAGNGRKEVLQQMMPSQPVQTVFALSDNEEPSLTIVSNSSLPRTTKVPKTPNQQIVTLGHAYYGDRGTVSTYDIHILPTEGNFPGQHQVIDVAPPPKHVPVDGSATLPMPEKQPRENGRKRSSSKTQRRSLADVPANPMSHKVSNQSIYASQLCETALIHSGSPTIRADVDLLKTTGSRSSRTSRKQWPNVSEVRGLKENPTRKCSLATPPSLEAQPRRSRQKSLPTNSILDDNHEVETDFGTKEPDPLMSPERVIVPKDKKSALKGAKSKRQAAMILHRRKNSYKQAQEREFIDDWLGAQERRKSIGHLEDEISRYTPEVKPRTSSSLGNILQADDEIGRFRPLQPSPSTQTVIRIPIASLEPAGHLPGGHDLKDPRRSQKLKSSYHYERHPLSHSTTTILDSTKDPRPILPNRSPGTPDVWVPRSIKA
ncbi:hypothetical protein TCAL_06908 [Tigriopus californicus]|uniref:SSD domain-containing protein n=1 Tax=Tigriopus californicus TaxID=6832 RepID=A0A553PLP0_TIGCA|nr:hypothetical protein TCAL_06908 [Tigriopus californicus]